MVSGYGEAGPGEELRLPENVAHQVYSSAPNDWVYADVAEGNGRCAPVDDGIVEDFLGLTVSGLKGVIELEENVSFLQKLMGCENEREHPRRTAIEAIGRRLNALAPEATAPVGGPGSIGGGSSRR
jgi:hypothetical protein